MAVREPERRRRQRMSLEAVKQSPPSLRTSQTVVDEDRGRVEADAKQSKESRGTMMEDRVIQEEKRAFGN
ncbi:hypothetical protein NL676_018224 [Syzygium grande]|nr:hypothetical protein NL676_018224 [Syzygium grande]